MAWHECDGNSSHNCQGSPSCTSKLLGVKTTPMKLYSWRKSWQRGLKAARTNWSTSGPVLRVPTNLFFFSFLFFVTGIFRILSFTIFTLQKSQVSNAGFPGIFTVSAIYWYLYDLTGICMCLKLDQQCCKSQKLLCSSAHFKVCLEERDGFGKPMINKSKWMVTSRPRSLSLYHNLCGKSIPGICQMVVPLCVGVMWSPKVWSDIIPFTWYHSSEIG